MTAEPRMRRRPANAGGRSGASPRGNVIEDRDEAAEAVAAFTSELWARLGAFVRELRQVPSVVPPSTAVPINADNSSGSFGKLILEWVRVGSDLALCSMTSLEVDSR